MADKIELAQLTDKQKGLIVVGMELVVEEFTGDNFSSCKEFEITPSQIYDYCDEIYGGDSSNVRGGYLISPQKPPARETITNKQASRISELEKALTDIAVLAEEGNLELYAVGSIISEVLSE